VDDPLTDDDGHQSQYREQQIPSLHPRVIRQ
jgi:hypothetical protein